MSKDNNKGKMICPECSNEMEEIVKGIIYCSKCKKLSKIEDPDQKNEEEDDKRKGRESIENYRELMRSGSSLTGGINNFDIYDCYDNSENSEFPILPSEKSKDRNNLNNTINSLISQANKKRISLKGFIFLASQPYISQVEQTIFKKAIIMLNTLIDNNEFPKYIPTTTLTQLMLDGKTYLTKQDLGFQKAKEQYYGGIIYDITCKLPLQLFPNFSGKHYLGRTHKRKIKRLMEHIDEALKPEDSKNRLLLQAILIALEQEGYNIVELQNEYSSLNPFFKNLLLERLVLILIEKYFSIDIIEIHSNYHTAPAREKYYIKDYRHSVHDRMTVGTKTPKGLNMIESGGSIHKYITLPLYDIAFMIALGYNETEIAKIINSEYKLNLNSKQISTRVIDFFKGLKNARVLFLKPILQKILTEFPDIKRRDFSEILKYSRVFYPELELFKIFFENLNFKQLKQVMRQKDFNWDNLKQLAEDLRDVTKIRGVSKSQWIEWLIKNESNLNICNKIGLNIKDSHSATTTISRIINSSTELIGRSKMEAVRYYRRIKTIDYKLRGKTLEWIYTQKFFLENTGSWNLNRFHDKFFGSIVSYEVLDSMNVEDLILFKHKITQYLD